MSKLTGHKQITRQAVKELKVSPQFLDFRSLKAGYLLNAKRVSYNAQVRDVVDIFNLGHWGNSGQKHHFMRQFDGQSEMVAYKDNLKWISSRGVIAANKFATAYKWHVMIDSPVPRAASDYYWVTELGYACHAIQDSFSRGHTWREQPKGKMTPGDIIRILRYSGDEKNGHSGYDKEWGTTDGGKPTFSLQGRLAINATKEFILLVMKTGLMNYNKGSRAVNLEGWSNYKKKWLNVSPKLSQSRDDAIDIINQFYTGLSFGDFNLMTLSMDEEGLATALINNYGSDTKKVSEVFKRLNEKYSSDSDDVARIYIEKIKSSSSTIKNALKNDKELISQLTSILNLGNFTRREAEAVNYINAL